MDINAIKQYAAQNEANVENLKQLRQQIETDTTNPLAAYLEAARALQDTDTPELKLAYQAVWQGLNALITAPTPDKADTLLAVRYAELVKKYGSAEPDVLTRLQGNLLYTWFCKHPEDVEARDDAKRHFEAAIAMGDKDSDWYVTKILEATPGALKSISVTLFVNGEDLQMTGKIDAEIAKTLKQLYTEQVIDQEGSVEDFNQMIKNEHPEIIAELDKLRDKFIREYINKNSMEEGYIGPFLMESEFDGENISEYTSGSNKLDYDFTDVSEYIED